MKDVARGATTSSLLVEDVTRVYVSHREVLVRKALRKVHDQALAEEIVQDSFLKLMLAAPEIANEEHLLAYLHTTIDNLCISYARKSGARPDLVAIDSEMTGEQIAELIDPAHEAMDAELIRAEDAAIVREAISRLSEADRAVLLAETFEGLSAEDISKRYGMSTKSVHVAISRARRNLRNVLETWIIDEETGMTAAEFLSKTYKKAAENSKKIGTAALSLVLLVSAFFGFWNNPAPTSPVASPKPVTSTPQVETPAATQEPIADPVTTETEDPTTLASAQTWALDYLTKIGPLGWPGLDANGIPTGFTVNDGAGFSGLALISSNPFNMDINSGEVSTESRFTTFQDGLNVILSQRFSNKSGQLSYAVNPMVRVGGAWIELSIASRSIEIKRLADGRYLVTCWMIVDIDKSAASTPIAGIGLGNDLKRIPAVIATRLITTEIGTPISGQAVQVLDALETE